jgi:hypothetical protein
MPSYKFSIHEKLIIWFVYTAVIALVFICGRDKDTPLGHAQESPEPPYITQPGDTTYPAEEIMNIKVGKDKYMMTIGDASVYRDRNGKIKRGKWQSVEEQSGIYEHAIKEKLITRVSQQAPSYKVSNGDDYVSFTFEGGIIPADSFKFRVKKDGWIWKNNAGKYEIEIAVSKGRVKETITTRKQLNFNWLIDANKMLNPCPDGSIITGEMKIEKPTAVDKNGSIVAASANLEWNNGWWYKLTIDTRGKQFPIIIDPSIMQISSKKSYAGYGVVTHATWATARDAANADAVANNAIYMYRYDNYIIGRAIMNFNFDSIATGTYTVSACSLIVDKIVGSSGVMTKVTTTGFWDTLDVGAYSQFTGRVTGGADNFKTITIPKLGTAGIDNNDTLIFTDYGCDSLELKMRATSDRNFRLMMMTRGDSANSPPTADSNVVYAGSAGSGEAPYLRIAYTKTAQPKCSLSVGSRYDSIRYHVYYDTTDQDSVRFFRISGSDTIGMGTTKTGFALNNVGGFSANTQYFCFARTYDAGDSVRTNIDTIRTRPDTGTFIFNGTHSQGFYITPAVGPQNPSATKLSVKDSSKSKTYSKTLYLTLTGDTSSVERFYGTSLWGMQIISGYTRGQTGIFAVRAQNDDSTYKSGWEIDSLQIPVSFDSISFTAIDTHSIRVVFDSDTFLTGKRLRPFVYSGTDTAWGDSINFNSTANYDTIIGLSLNKKYYGKVRLTDSSNNKYYSTIDSARTWSWRPSAVTASWINDTTFILTITKHTGVPVNSGYFVLDSTRVPLDCTKVYMHPDSFGYILARKIGSATAMSDTYRVRRGQWTAGVTVIKVRVHAINRDSLGNY